MVMTVQGFVTAMPKWSWEAFAMLSIMTVHLVIFTPLLFLAAAVVTRVVFWVLAPRKAMLVILIGVAALFVAASYDIYRLPGHNSAPPANLADVASEYLPAYAPQ